MLFDFTLPPRKYNKPNFKQVQTNLLRTQPGRSVIAAAEQSLKSWSVIGVSDIYTPQRNTVRSDCLRSGSAEGR